MTIINFKVNDNGKIMNVSYDNGITCEQFMRDFTKKLGYESIDPDVYTFKVGAKLLNMPLYKSKQLKDLITDEQIVNFRRKKNMNYSN